jgi:deazaflavin-dependent oxidoreductase (nitroreductase family)
LTQPGREPMEDDLVTSGRFVRIETHGRRSGEPRTATVGFVAEAAGSILVAAGEPDADWALNLDAEPACRMTIGAHTTEATAEALDGEEHAMAIRGLILRYGTPAEGLGHGPSFRLRPAAESAR